MMMDNFHFMTDTGFRENRWQMFRDTIQNFQIMMDDFHLITDIFSDDFCVYRSKHAIKVHAWVQPKIHDSEACEFHQKVDDFTCVAVSHSFLLEDRLIRIFLIPAYRKGDRIMSFCSKAAITHTARMKRSVSATAKGRDIPLYLWISGRVIRGNISDIFRVGTLPWPETVAS
jgi:hypothetical protein